MLELLNSYLSGVIVPFLVVSVGALLCVRLGCFHILRPQTVVRALGDGGASSARAVALALAGTLGVGNIVGVASAIHLGGFGAVFWMWVSALVAMLLKYAEIVLAMRHRRTDTDGQSRGAAMYYLKDVLASHGFARLGALVAAVFALLFLVTALSMGGMLQSGAVAEALDGVLGVPKIYVGATMALVLFLAMRKGTHSICALTNVLVPLMTLGYVVMSLAVILRRADALDDALISIFRGAFRPSAAVSGVGCFAVLRAIRYGVMRGLISNEAGCGTAPAAHSIADEESPARQGMWGIFEVFVDTVVLCTLTALVIILNYGEASRWGGNYMMMTLSSFSVGLGRYTAYLLCAAVGCFALATLLCWGHYGLVCVRFFTESKYARWGVTLLYCTTAFVGAIAPSALSWLLSDLAVGSMTVINLLCLALASREIKDETDTFMKGSKKNSKRQSKSSTDR